MIVISSWKNVDVSYVFWARGLTDRKLSLDRLHYFDLMTSVLSLHRELLALQAAKRDLQVQLAHLEYILFESDERNVFMPPANQVTIRLEASIQALEYVIQRLRTRIEDLHGR